MNVNEVVANVASQRAGKAIGSKDPVHPNDHVNHGQSSNDTYPSSMQIAGALRIAQRLVPRGEGKGRVAAMEIMLNSPLISDLIFKGDVAQIKEVMARSTRMGMQTFDQALFALYEGRQISYEDALRNADSKNELRLRVKLESKRENKPIEGDGDLDAFVGNGAGNTLFFVNRLGGVTITQSGNKVEIRAEYKGPKTTGWFGRSPDLQVNYVISAIIKNIYCEQIVGEEHCLLARF